MRKPLQDIKHYAKIHTATFLAILIAFIVVTTWIIPREDKTNTAIMNNYNQIAANYDTTTGTYNNMDKVLKLQNEVSEVQSQSELVKLAKVGFFAVILTAITGLLGMFLQFIYTKLKFTNGRRENATVLASVILATTVIVMVTFLVVFG